MDNATIQRLKQEIEGSENIGIAIGKNPSMDTMASALALYLLFKNANKNVSIASPSDPLVEVSSLVGIDKVKKSIGTSDGDLTVSFPYVEGEIEKVSYTLEEGFLNIIVKATEQGLSFDEKDVQYIKGSGSVDLLFVVGTQHLSELEQIVDAQNPNMRIINIDNKDTNEQFGDIVLVSKKLSTVSEGVADLALSLGMHIDQDTAQNLLSGITDETSNFQDSKTSSLAFEMAALLMKKGAVRESSISARRGINLNSQVQNQFSQKGQSQKQQISVDQRRVNDKRDQDRKRFEDNLQKRVKEEREREARNAKKVPQNSPGEDILSDDETPTDWLAPKVYKGSSEV